MSLWMCQEHGLHGPMPANCCPTCGKPMAWASVSPRQLSVDQGTQLNAGATPCEEGGDGGRAESSSYLKTHDDPRDCFRGSTFPLKPKHVPDAG